METSGLWGAFLAPLFWATILALCLWFVRRFFPRSEPYLFGPISNVGYLIGLGAGRLWRPIARRVAQARQGSGRQAPSCVRRRSVR